MPELLDLAHRLASRARHGEQVEVFAGRWRTLSVRAYGGEVESLSSAESAGVGIRVVSDHRQGFASAGSLDTGVVEEALAEARDNATFGEPDEGHGMANPDGVEPPPLELFSPRLAAVATPAKVELALALERAVLAGDPRVHGVRSAVYADADGEVAVATSTGIGAWGREGSCSLSVSALASDGGETQTGFGVAVARHPDDLDLDTAARDAVDRATRMLGARRTPSRRLTVVLEPRVAAAFLAVVGGMLTGERVIKGRSPFADRLGEAVASPSLTLVDDPTDARSWGADPFDGEGLATRRNPLVEGGALRRFLHNTYTGRRAGGASTASAVRGYTSTPGVGCQALALAPGARPPEELVGDVADGLLVQAVSGLHSGVNPVSGDFSVGAEGILIRGGVPAEPVREVTIASTVPRMLLDLRAVGSDLEWLPSGTASPTIVIDEVTLSGS